MQTSNSNRSRTKRMEITQLDTWEIQVIHFQRKKKEGLHASVSAAEEVKTPKISHVSPIC